LPFSQILWQKSSQNIALQAEKQSKHCMVGYKLSLPNKVKQRTPYQTDILKSFSQANTFIVMNPCDQQYQYNSWPSI